jgi:hypothetical protein
MSALSMQNTVTAHSISEVQYKKKLTVTFFNQAFLGYWF